VGLRVARIPFLAVRRRRDTRRRRGAIRLQIDPDFDTSRSRRTDVDRRDVLVLGLFGQIAVVMQVQVDLVLVDGGVEVGVEDHGGRGVGGLGGGGGARAAVVVAVRVLRRRRRGPRVVGVAAGVGVAAALLGRRRGLVAGRPGQGHELLPAGVVVLAARRRLEDRRGREEARVLGAGASAGVAMAGAVPRIHLPAVGVRGLERRVR